MSVEELKLTTRPADMSAKIEDDKIVIQVVDLDGLTRIQLDRNQAHLLKLWLEEHLNPDGAPKGYWLCGCGKYHKEDFVCEMLK